MTGADFWQVLRDWATLAILAATVWATIYGPTRVYKLQQKSEAEREKRRRQFDILHSLMRTRMANLLPEHVMALNLIQLEFYGCNEVQEAYRRYHEHLNSEAPEDRNSRQHWLDDRYDRFYTLIKAMAAVLEYQFDKTDLRRLSYAPQGWANEEDAQRTLRGLLIDLLSGRRPIPVVPFHQSDINSKFPKPPGNLNLPTGLKATD